MTEESFTSSNKKVLKYIQKVHCVKCRDRNYLVECSCCKECKDVIIARTKDYHWRAVKNEHSFRFTGNLNRSRKGELNSQWKGGRRKHSSGYILKYAPDHPFKDSSGYVHEHRWIMEQQIRRYLTKEEDVHHINGIKDDNRLENLKLMTKSEHISHHRIQDLKDKKPLFGKIQKRIRKKIGSL